MSCTFSQTNPPTSIGDTSVPKTFQSDNHNVILLTVRFSTLEIKICNMASLVETKSRVNSGHVLLTTVVVGDSAESPVTLLKKSLYD